MSETFHLNRERILAAHVPGESPADALVLADFFEEHGDLRLAATALDRAYGLAPDDRALAARRHQVLEGLAVVERGICFRYVPAGTFLMGSDSGDDDERPVHAVRLGDYWVADVPVSWAAYCELMDWFPPPRGVPREEPSERMAMFSLHNANKIRLQYCETETVGARNWHAHRPDDEWSSGQTSREIFGEVPRANPDRPFAFDQKPMVAVAWQMAEELCEQLSTPAVNYRLPTEAEWEKAARGGLIQRRYSWGDDPPTPRNCDCDHFGTYRIRPPRELPPNGYGLYGTCGGVWEWTADRYDRLAYDAAAPPAEDDAVQPKVLRGGSWSDCAEGVTVSFRAARGSSHWRDEPDYRDRDSFGHMTPTIGFRLFRFEADA